MARILEYTAAAEDEGRSVRDVMSNVFGLVAHDISRAKYRKDGIMLDGEHVWVNRAMLPGQVLKVTIEDSPSGKIIPVEGDLDIIYEDEDLIAVNKPAGMVVHPSHGHYMDSLGNILAGYMKSNGDEHEIRSIGRLDRETSGLILFGKNRTAVSKLVEQADMGIRSKEYLALAKGRFGSMEGMIDAPIGRMSENNMKRAVREDGDSAGTHYEVLEQYGDIALLRIRLMTGRTHQIRVHMAYIGHPLLGDSLYGNGMAEGMERAALHSYRISFRQPFTGEEIDLEAPIPADFSSAMRRAICRSTDLTDEKSGVNY